MKSKFLLLLLVLLTLSSLAFTALNIERFYESDSELPTFEEMFSFYEDWLTHHSGPGIENNSERFAIFSKRALQIIKHNQNPHRTYNKTINYFTGRSLDEIKKRTLMLPQNCTLDDLPLQNSTGTAGPTDFFDWRDTHKVTPVRIQRRCGSSWAFAAVAAVETHWAIRTDSTAVLSSEQQLIDCSYDYGNQGCLGGLPQSSFEYLSSVKGLTAEATYPYEGIAVNKCRYADSKVYARVFNGSVNITAGDELAIFYAVNSTGPVTIGLDVTEDLFAYGGGIYQSMDCRNDTRIINHVATVVGYGYDDPKDLGYWIVKNSWGTGWGEEGYFRIARGVNMCGLANCASYPNLNYTNLPSASHTLSI